MGRGPCPQGVVLSMTLIAATAVLERLRGAGHEAYLVGGWVRDSLLGRPHEDCDVATSATPEQVEALFERSVPLGRRFGVVHVVQGQSGIEVATFRGEGPYADGRRPETVWFSQLEEDARRRDFTINALYFDPMEDRVVDPLGVRSDLDARLLRTVGDPDSRFREDHLRLLRAVRLSCTLGFAVEPATLDSIRRNAALVRSVAAERVREELRRILTDAGRAGALRMLEETGLLSHLLPEIAALRGVGQSADHHPEGDAWVHTLLVLDRLGPGPSFPLAFAALFHDAGKARTRTEEGGRVRFLGHEERGAEMTEAAGRRLRLSRRERERAVWLVRHHLVLLEAPRMRRSTLRRWLANPGFPDLLALHRADVLASGGELAGYRTAEAALEELGEEPARPTPLLGGKDLLSMGIEPGPAVGEILRRVETAQLDGEIADRAEALRLGERLARESGVLPPAPQNGADEDV